MKNSIIVLLLALFPLLAFGGDDMQWPDVSGQDGDGDGYAGNQGDCDDMNVTIHPGATDIPNNGLDEDCNGSDKITKPAFNYPTPTEEDDTNVETPDPLDADADGYSTSGDANTIDCNDSSPLIHPNAAEIPYNETDENCDGTDLTDVDKDGYNYPDDCDDYNAGVHPGINGACPITDTDGDYYTTSDCDNANASIKPGAVEICDDGIDNNCDGQIDDGDSACPNSGGSSGGGVVPPGSITDTDGDGVPDDTDTDDDNDGVLDTEDAYPLDANKSVAEEETATSGSSGCQLTAKTKTLNPFVFLTLLMPLTMIIRLKQAAGSKNRD